MRMPMLMDWRSLAKQFFLRSRNCFRVSWSFVEANSRCVTTVSTV